MIPKIKSLTNAERVSDFYHTTNKENFDKMLRLGRLESLAHLARRSPRTRVNVEPNRWDRSRTVLQAKEALSTLSDNGKVPNRVFLTRGGVMPEYGDYVVKKQLSAPRKERILNLIPEEHTTGRALSLKHNAELIVPDDELDTFRRRYPKLRGAFRARGEAQPRELSRLHAIPELPGKLIGSLLKKEGTDLDGTGPVTGTGPKTGLRPAQINPRAFLGGSTGLGLEAEGADTDYDFIVPYSSLQHVMRAKDRYLQKYPDLAESPFNEGRKNKQVLSGKIGDVEVDITLAPGKGPEDYIQSIKDARERLTPEQRAAIKKRKAALKKAWILPETRYKKYKKELDRELGIKAF